LIAGEVHGPGRDARKLLARIRAAAPAGAEVDLAWNPEFLREGNAVQDTLRPDRFVFGVTSERAEALLRQVYEQPLADGIPALAMGLETAELVKVSANAFLATKISFVNAVADACEAAGADVTQLAGALAYDERIGGRSMSPGLGFGGGCLPKDLRAFRAAARSLYAKSVFEAAQGADLVLHLTEWTEYRSIDPAALAAVVARRDAIDARCVLDARAWESAGWSVRAGGRSA
jgi:UDPglucose 6-dehydrogenase